MSRPDTTRPALAVAGLTVDFDLRGGSLRAIDGISFSVAAGEILGLVGESGSGKSVTGLALLGLLRPPGRIVSGSVRLFGEELIGSGESAMRKVRGSRIAMIFQDPTSTLNPVLRISTQMIEAVRAHERVSEKAALAKAIEALERVGIASAHERVRAYPHQFSGGMRQRIAIATAMLNRPAVLVADEPTTALDVTIQAQILFEVQKLAEETGTAMIWITHDLSVVSGLADRIAIMYAGRLVEQGPVRRVLDRPGHHYTAGLLNSIPSSNEPGRPLRQIPGSPPALGRLVGGCTFRPRCAAAQADCTTVPKEVQIGESRLLCHHPRAEALK